MVGFIYMRWASYETWKTQTIRTKQVERLSRRVALCTNQTTRVRRAKPSKWATILGRLNNLGLASWQKISKKNGLSGGCN